MQIAIVQKNLNWINFIWFQAIWFVAVLYTYQAIPVLIISLCIHFLISAHRKADILTLLSITLMGSLADSLLIFLEILMFPNHSNLPFWLILLWSHFSLTLNYSMSWMSKIPIIICIVFGATFGTLSYYVGAELGAVNLHHNLILSLFSMGLIWGTLMPVYIKINKKIHLFSI